ncbi:hypothetical protein OXX79_000531 [Metschnikowia pulcherrima]
MRIFRHLNLLVLVAATTKTVAANISGEAKQLPGASMSRDYFFNALKESNPYPKQNENKIIRKVDMITRIETELELFAANMNMFLVGNSFNIIDFEHRIGILRRIMYDIDFRLEKVTKNKVYTQWLLKRFARQFFAMVEGAERMKRYLKTGEIGDKLVHDLIEITVLANSLDNAFSTSPRDAQEFKNRAMHLQCRYLAKVEEFRKVAGEKLHSELIAGYVTRAKRALRGLKDSLNDSSKWGVCP